MGELSGSLNVQVVKGSNLVIRDLVKMHSDPYVVIKLGEQTKKTRAIKRNLNPVWNEELTFNVANVSYSDRCLVTVEVWDKDRFTRDDFMGKAEYDLNPLLQQSYPTAIVKKDSYVNGHNGIRPIVRDVSLKLNQVHSGVLELKRRKPTNLIILHKVTL